MTNYGKNTKNKLHVVGEQENKFYSSILVLLFMSYYEPSLEFIFNLPSN